MGGLDEIRSDDAYVARLQHPGPDRIAAARAIEARAAVISLEPPRFRYWRSDLVPDKLLLPDARYARGRMLGSRIASGLHAAMISRDADRLRSADDAATILDGDVVGIVWICRGHKKSSLQERRAYLALQQRKDIRLAHDGGGELPGTPTRASARPLGPLTLPLSSESTSPFSC